MGVLEPYDDVVEKLTVLWNYLRNGSQILTIVLNPRGINWLFQRLVDVEILERHLIYSPKMLVQVH
jgi:hypothetical protein